MKEQRKAAKDGGDSTMKEMRERYDRAVEADQENRELGLNDLRFVAVPGNQWDEKQKKARRNRPCYEFPILRSHWRQVVNDQKKARPGIKVRAVEDGDAEGAELRQGIVRNIESVSNAERAYDAAFELLTAAGFGAVRVATEYSSDDAWEQDIVVRPIHDPLASVWFDPCAKEADLRDAEYCFVEQELSRAEFEAKYPKAEAVDFESAKRFGTHDWFREDAVRIAEYWRNVPEQRTLLLLSDGRTVNKADITPELAAQMAQEGVSVMRERVTTCKKIVMSIVSGAEEIDGPHDSVFDRIPIIPVFANRHFVDGKWVWAGMVRFSRDPQKLLNYNLTSAQEVLAKQHRATPVVTPKMLEGAGVKQLWDSANTADIPYLPYTPDPQMPSGPQYLSPPPVHAAFAQMAQISTDMLKASDGIFDASVGARSNETSGKAIMARQQEGDTATFDYQDALAFMIQSVGEVILRALPKVYDTPRQMRVLGKDGAEDYVKLYQPTPDGQVLNDLSAGKYDVTVSTGPGYDTMRMEFVDMLTQLGQSNPAIAAGVPDLIVGSMDFPKAEEAAERLKLLLPPPVQQALAQKDQSPAVMQLQGQIQQVQAQAQQAIGDLQQQLQQAQQKAASNEAAMLKAKNDAERLQLDQAKAAAETAINRLVAEQRAAREWFDAETKRLQVLQQGAQASQQLEMQAAQQTAEQIASDAEAS